VAPNITDVRIAFKNSISRCYFPLAVAKTCRIDNRRQNSLLADAHWLAVRRIMTLADHSADFESKFIEVVQQLLQQQIAADSRREAAESEQKVAWEKIQTQLCELTLQIDQLSAGASRDVQSAAPRPAQPVVQPHPNPHSNGSPKKCEALSEWERQKQAILQGLDVESGEASDATAAEPHNESASIAAPTQNGDSAPHDWIEHLDPNDPALIDDNERKQLVYRLRKLGVDLSLERAKLARERTEVEEKVSELERTEKEKAKANGNAKDRGKKDRLFRFLGKQTP
jgi:hypothetical protein